MKENNKKIKISVRRYLFYGVLITQSLFGMNKNDDNLSLHSEKDSHEKDCFENKKL